MNILKRETIRSGSLVCRVEGLIATESADGTFLVDAKGGKLFKLNMTGSAIWAQIDSPVCLDDLCQRLACDFSGDECTIQQDVTDLLAELLSRRLIRVSDAPAS